MLSKQENVGGDNVCFSPLRPRVAQPKCQNTIIQLTWTSECNRVEYSHLQILVLFPHPTPHPAPYLQSICLVRPSLSYSHVACYRVVEGRRLPQSGVFWGEGVWNLSPAQINYTELWIWSHASKVCPVLKLLWIWDFGNRENIEHLRVNMKHILANEVTKHKKVELQHWVK